MPTPGRTCHGPILDAESLFRQLNQRFFGGRLRANIEWSNRLTASAGSCIREDRLIRLSVPYHQKNPRALRITLAHEMCHLLAPRHDEAFRRLAAPIVRALRVSWEEFRYAKHWADVKRYCYVYECPSCGAELPTRKRQRVSCGRCSPREYRPEFRMTIRETRREPGPVLLGKRPVRTL
ncbi:MAG: SprT family zinc-dependent metalloprotease [Planctomycetes bacterium]|jgi:predicted SprT family Zn-dependent metalloprotease|nr:SprT family zinc-dependent metalloprotease [Planctomycetota bacterium]